MRSESRWWCVAAVIALWSLQSICAQAATASDEILVLGIFQSGKLKERPTTALSTHLRASEAVLAADGLLPSERQCQRSSCLVRIAEKSGARFVMWGVVLEGNARAPTTVMMHLFDTRQEAMDYLPGVVPPETPLEEVINQLGVRLLQHYRAPVTEIPWATHRVTLDDIGTPIPRRERPSRAWRVGVATGLGIVTVVWAIVAGVMFLRGRALLHSIAVDETVTAVKEDVQWAQQQRS